MVEKSVVFDKRVTARMKGKVNKPVVETKLEAAGLFLGVTRMNRLRHKYFRETVCIRCI